MSHLVGYRLRYVFLAVRELLREGPACAIDIGARLVVEDAYIGDASRTGVVPVRRTDNHAHAVIDIAGGAPSKPSVARVLRRDIDVERCVILRNSLPYILNQVHLRGVEG